MLCTETLGYVDNILRMVVMSDDDSLTYGLGWYSEAKEIARGLDPDNVSRAVGVIAAMSPLTSWPQNLRMAQAVYRGETPKGLKGNIGKAIRIFNGESPETVLSGEKVTSFYANIMGLDGVTVDRHAMDVCAGKVQTNAERSAMVKRTKARDGYSIVRNAYIHAAEILSEEWGKTVSARQIQAVVWVYWRRVYIPAFHGDFA